MPVNFFTGTRFGRGEKRAPPQKCEDRSAVLTRMTHRHLQSHPACYDRAVGQVELHRPARPPGAVWCCCCRPCCQPQQLLLLLAWAAASVACGQPSLIELEVRETGGLGMPCWLWVVVSSTLAQKAHNVQTAPRTKHSSKVINSEQSWVTLPLWVARDEDILIHLYACLFDCSR